MLSGLPQAASLLLVTLLLLGHEAVAQPAPGLQDWCKLSSNINSTSCSALTPCPTRDGYWSEPARCSIPGYPLTYPVNYDSCKVCAGMAGVATRELRDLDGTVYGSVRFFRTYGNQLLVTATLNGDAGGSQWYWEYPNRATDANGVPYKGAVLNLADPAQPLTDRPQYADPVFVSGRYLCVTWVVDLAHVCDAATSRYEYSAISNDNFYCKCYDSTRPCPPQDLSQLAVLQASVRLNLTQFAAPSSAGCGGQAAPPAYKIVGTLGSNPPQFVGDQV
eukprot:CAMPEP_0202860932 /NCGR_PEP_ID=MMETSP1391-20130828/2493_1 /ASSEMBLY_ACC=CAM_ASM_000867 /TAXON_ID=1034604 /ORGANISM="Chlamydomonas leiostraca, Strain SAG 11-49" /LENGTH=275 /DNA_ID=CAMNT_0049540221 /DNA_START=208 /DNA_END=1031 /DNA_ORIENTATION=-